VLFNPKEMNLRNLKYEWKVIMRDRTIPFLFVLFLVLTVFAIRNGKEKVTERMRAIERARTEVAQSEENKRKEIDSTARGLKVYPQDPRMLSMYGQRNGRIVAMDAQPLAFMATGQSDLFTHYAKPRLYGEAHTLGFSELSNPVQLLFGSFDLSFVCIYLLPLLALAFSYNILSSEKESGSLRLTMAQPVSLFQWLLGKFLIRFFILAGVILISILGGLVFLKIGFPARIILFLSIVLLYTLFWFTLAFLVNLTGTSSGSNAVKLVSIWIVVVLLLPAVISQLANTLYPVPSRIKMIHQYRVAEAEADKRANEILKTYYRDHPELAPTDTARQNRYQFWIEYFASVEVVKNAVTPVLEEYDRQLNLQQSWVDRFRFVSPAILMQDALNDLSGTSSRHYTDFRRQVIAFADEWRGYFRPRMFRNEWMQTTDFDTLPNHRYTPDQVPSTYPADFLAIMLFFMATLSASYIIYQRQSAEQILTA
jgi:ABC-2 type transport system permease protein